MSREVKAYLLINENTEIFTFNIPDGFEIEVINVGNVVDVYKIKDHIGGERYKNLLARFRSEELYSLIVGEHDWSAE